AAVLGNAPRRTVAIPRPNGRPTENESLSITPVRASATFSLSRHRKSKRRIRAVSPLISIRNLALNFHLLPVAPRQRRTRKKQNSTPHFTLRLDTAPIFPRNTSGDV